MGNYFSSKEIIKASETGNLKRVLQLIKEGTDVNIQDSYGYTSLMRASSSGRLEVVKELIKTGANLDIQNKWGNTALIWAFYLDHLEIVKLLIKVGANTDLTDKYNHCVLWDSLSRKNYKISNLLLKSIKNFNKECLEFKKKEITFFYLFPFIRKSKKCLINKIPDDLIGLLLKF